MFRRRYTEYSMGNDPSPSIITVQDRAYRGSPARCCCCFGMKPADSTPTSAYCHDCRVHQRATNTLEPPHSQTVSPIWRPGYSFLHSAHDDKSRIDAPTALSAPYAIGRGGPGVPPIAMALRGEAAVRCSALELRLLFFSFAVCERGNAPAPPTRCSPFRPENNLRCLGMIFDS